MGSIQEKNAMSCDTATLRKLSLNPQTCCYELQVSSKLRAWPKPEVLKIGFVKDTLFHQTDGRLYGTSSQPCQRMPGSDVGSGGFIVLGILLTSGSVPGSGVGSGSGFIVTSGSVPGSGVALAVGLLYWEYYSHLGV